MELGLNLQNFRLGIPGLQYQKLKERKLVTKKIFVKKKKKKKKKNMASLSGLTDCKGR